MKSIGTPRTYHRFKCLSLRESGFSVLAIFRYVLTIGGKRFSFPVNILRAARKYIHFLCPHDRKSGGIMFCTCLSVCLSVCPSHYVYLVRLGPRLSPFLSHCRTYTHQTWTTSSATGLQQQPTSCMCVCASVCLPHLANGCQRGHRHVLQTQFSSLLLLRPVY